MTQQPKLSVHAKAILCGEHSVLRGGQAIVIPLPNMTLSLEYMPSKQPLEIMCQGSHASPALALFFRGLIDSCLQQIQSNQHNLTGQIQIQNEIAMGMGLGFSGAACALIAKWFVQIGIIEPQNVFEIAKQLEHQFHSQSSGCDIMGALENKPFLFTMNQLIKPVAIRWQPHLYLSHCGQHSPTSQSVKHVTSLYQNQAEIGRTIDDRMSAAVTHAIAGLTTEQTEGSLLLKMAVQESNQCFENWGLISPELKDHCSALIAMGATAVKPTGAGNGGFVISLWNTPPNQTSSIEFIQLINQTMITKNQNQTSI